MAFRSMEGFQKDQKHVYPGLISSVFGLKFDDQTNVLKNVCQKG